MGWEVGGLCLDHFSELVEMFRSQHRAEFLAGKKGLNNRVEAEHFDLLGDHCLGSHQLDDGADVDWGSLCFFVRAMVLLI